MPEICVLHFTLFPLFSSTLPWLFRNLTSLLGVGVSLFREPLTLGPAFETNRLLLISGWFSFSLSPLFGFTYADSGRYHLPQLGSSPCL